MNLVQFKKFQCRRSFGVEVEVGNEVPISHIRRLVESCSSIPVKSNYYRATINNSFWDIKHDGSCGKKTDKYGINEGGFEINSFKANSLMELLHICHVVRNLKSLGLQVNKNCGFHVHVDIHDFTEDQVGILISNWLCIERCIMQSVPYNRKRNKYCQRVQSCRYPIQTQFENANEVWEKYKPKSTKLHDNTDRRLALNLVNYYRHLKLKNFHRSTIEFRFPEGTLSQNNVKNWCRIFINFVNKMKQEKYCVKNISNFGVAQTLEVLGLHGNKSTFALLSPGLYESKKWFLKRIIRYAEYSHMDLSSEAREILNNMEIHHGV